MYLVHIYSIVKMNTDKWLSHRFQVSFARFQREHNETLFLLYNELFKDYHTTITWEDFIHFAYFFSKQ